MKRFLTVLCFVSLLVSAISCSSKEEKAAALIKERMFQTLYDFDSYQPIMTVVDTAFYTPFIDNNIKLKAREAASVREEMRNLTKDLKEIVNDMKYYGFLYSRKELKDKLAESERIGEEYDAKHAIYDSLEVVLKDLVLNCSSEPIGWVAFHKFRCKTKGGSADIGKRLYYFDKKIKTITDEFDLDDKDEDGTLDVLMDIIMNSDNGDVIMKHFANTVPVDELMK